ncbi:MAG TPA: Gfo/Idh/MocA family oxidoreductase [Pirellulaceae bacterium]|nr:Gfo/Idh/MocA family oxidoreductase [Pirellulaceae bacterium]
MKLRAGIIGLGDAWETRHRPALRSLGDRFEIRAICSDVALLAEQAAREFSAQPVDGFRALTEREDIDVILILSPDWYGLLPIVAACDAGKAVYCAAGLDIDPDQARQLRDRVETSGIAFMAEFPRRQSPATLRLKELICTRLGKPRLLFCHQRRAVDTKGNGRKNGKQPMSETRELMELVDWCRYVVGEEPTSVVGVRHVSPISGDRDDYQMMSLDFSPSGSPGTGATAQISSGHYIPGSWPEAIAFRPPAALQVCCEKGIAFIDLPATLTWFDEAGRHMESLESERPVGEQLLMMFHRAVTSLVRKTSDLEDAYRALQVVIAAKQSFTDQRRITLDF